MLPRRGTYRGRRETRSRTCRRPEWWPSGFLCGGHLRQSCPGTSRDACCETSFLKIVLLDFLSNDLTISTFLWCDVEKQGEVGGWCKRRRQVQVSPLLQPPLEWVRVTGIRAASSHSHCHPSITELPLSSRFGPAWPDYAPRAAAELWGARAGQTGP